MADVGARGSFVKGWMRPNISGEIQGESEFRNQFLDLG